VYTPAQPLRPLHAASPASHLSASHLSTKLGNLSISPPLLFPFGPLDTALWFGGGSELEG